MRQWYRIENKADENAADIYVYDVIGASFWEDSISAKQFIDELKALPASVQTARVRINSPGGDPFDATAIANALRNWAKDGRTVETIVDGLAASAASIVAMAGSVVQMSDNALMMIHDPWALAIGDSGDMRKMADTLDTIRDSIVATYRWHSELSDAEIRTLMADETWMDADEAIANGFATEKVEGLKAAALLDPKGLAKLKVPEKFRARVDALVKQPEPAPQAVDAGAVLTACAEAGLDLTFAQTLVAAKLQPAEVQARIDDERTRKANAQARAQEITGVCAAAKLPELAAGYIAGGMSLTDIRAHLTTITAKLDKVEIDGNLDPDHKAQKPGSWENAFARANRLH